MTNSALTRLIAATSLEEIALTLSPEPFTTPAEIKAFYRKEMNDTRGGDKIGRLKLGLNQSLQKGYYKACLIGHPGVGKSTEINKLLNDPDFISKFRAIKFNILTDIDPINFNPLDIVLFIIIKIVEETAEIAERPNNEILQKLWDWFSTEEITRKETKDSTIQGQAGAGIKEDSLWSKMLGLFASVKGEFRYASSREKKIVEYRFSRLNELIIIVNKLLDDCHQSLKKKLPNKCQWLVIGENFDKSGVSIEALKDLFINYNNLIKDLNVHLIFTIPIGLYNSSEAIRLAFPSERCFIVPDSAVFLKDKYPNTQGRNALKKVLETRVNLDLFTNGQMERVIIASGGNIRDLFYLVNYAAATAIINERDKIGANDINMAIGNLRTEYERRLGQNPFDVNQDQVEYEDKRELLIKIYEGDRETQIPNKVLYALLTDRAIQEVFDPSNGERYFMVHPLVVDILNSQGHVSSSPQGGVPGGTSST
jgi:hypothetical protein